MTDAEVLDWFASQPRWWRVLVHRAVDVIEGRKSKRAKLLNYLRLYLEAQP